MDGKIFGNRMVCLILLSFLLCPASQAVLETIDNKDEGGKDQRLSFSQTDIGVRDTDTEEDIIEALRPYFEKNDYPSDTMLMHIAPSLTPSEKANLKMRKKELVNNTSQTLIPKL